MAAKREVSEGGKDRARGKQINIWTFPELKAELEAAVNDLVERGERDLMGGSPKSSWVIESLICWFVEQVKQDRRATVAAIKAANRAWIDRLDERLQSSPSVAPGGIDMKPTGPATIGHPYGPDVPAAKNRRAKRRA